MILSKHYLISHEQASNLNFLTTVQCTHVYIQRLKKELTTNYIYLRNYLIKDIVEGMVYLHKHFIHHHGNLKSTNCLITTRFAVKISDFGLRVFREQSPKEFESEFARSRSKFELTAFE